MTNLTPLGRERKNYFEKLKATWYFDTPLSKIWYVLSSFALLLLIMRLIAGRGIW
jgi:hypothetical protein